MELNDIQEMTLADIEKTLADNEKKISSNLSKIQKLLESCNQLTDENKKLETESKQLNQQKFQKLFEETKARMFAQIEQAKMLSVENLLAPPKAKTQKKDKAQKNISPPEAKISDSVEAVPERSVDCGT